MMHRNCLQAVLCLPFDLARLHYAEAVRAGVIERSLLASARFGKLLNGIEVMALGPYARSR